MLIEIFENIMSGCACIIVLCLTIGAVTVTTAFVKSIIENEREKY
jgi:hypothetical protein